jgi:hypothetical protein
MLGHAGVIGASGVAAAGGPDVYYYTSGWSATPSIDGYQTWDNHLYGYGSPVVIAQAGTATTISMHVGSSSGNLTYKLALYDNSGNLLGSGTTGTISSGSQAWRNITVNVPVSAGTYWVYCSSSTSQGMRSYISDNGADGVTDAYATFPTDPLGSTTPMDGYLYGARIYVD